jgi:hypothetical protein
VIEQGTVIVETEEMEPVEIRFKTSSEDTLYIYGWGEQEWETLPSWSTFNQDKQAFSWIPTPGFIGTYEFQFAYTDGTYISQPLHVRLKISPKASQNGIKKQRQIKR